MRGGEGPRDWSPPGYWSESSPTVSQRPCPPAANSWPRAAPVLATHSRNRFRGALISWFGIALALGAIAIGPVVLGKGYMAVTPISVSIFAVVLGLRARSMRKRGQTRARIAPVAAVVLGVGGVLVNGFPFVHDLFPPASDVGWTASRELAAPGGVPPVGAPVASPSDEVKAPTRHPESPELSRAAIMSQSLGTLSFVLKHNRGEDGLWPAVLGITSAGEVFDPLSAQPDRVLTVIPSDSRLDYRVSDDRTSYSMTLTANEDTSLAVRYDSRSDLLSVG